MSVSQSTCVETMSRDRRIDGATATWSHEDAIAAALSRRRHRRDRVLSLSLPRRNESEPARNRQRNDPLPSFLETSRIDGVKAPPHDGTPRSHVVVARLLLQNVLRVLVEVPRSLRRRDLHRRGIPARERRRRETAAAPSRDAIEALWSHEDAVDATSS